jgi:uncharacterized protein (DUF1919 family)
MYKIIIWGIGNVYNQLLNTIHYFEISNQIEVAALAANECFGNMTLDGYPIIHKSEIITKEFDYIIVATDLYFDEIINEAVEGMGIEREKIIPFRVMQIPNLNFGEYIRLKNSKLSIVSNNCWGGLICHTLGIECLSPFKNVSFSDMDYIKILNDLERYLKADPIWNGEKRMDTNSNIEVPVLKLEDVSIKCNHELDGEAAIRNWKRRRDKFNWNNILVEMYTEYENVEREFLQLPGFEKKICFVPYESDRKESVKLYRMPGQNKFWEAVNSNAGVGRNSICYNVLDILLMMKSCRLQCII